MSGKRLGAVIVLVCASLWGLGGIAAQLIYENSDITTAFLIEARMLFSGIVLVGFTLAIKGKQIFTLFTDKENIFKFIIYCIFGNFMVQYSYFEAVQYSNGATATLLQYLGPTFVLISMCIVERKRPTLLQVGCVLAALMGLFLISTHGSLNSLSISAPALIWGVISAGSLAVNATVPVRLMERHHPCAVTGFAMLIGAAFTHIIFNPFSGNYNITPQVWWLIGFLCLFATAIPFSGFLYGLKLVGSTTGSILGNIEPLVASLVSVIFLHTPVTIYDVMGFCLIIGVAVILGACSDKA